MRGRKPKASRLRLLEQDRDRVVGGVTPPTRPDWLSSDAAIEWERVVAELSQSYLITPLDAITLAAYCETYSLWRKAMEELKTTGFTVATREGCKASPTVKIAMGLVVELRRMASEFGFSPASRSRIDVQRPDGKEEDDFEKL